VSRSLPSTSSRSINTNCPWISFRKKIYRLAECPLRLIFRLILFSRRWFARLILRGCTTRLKRRPFLAFWRKRTRRPSSSRREGEVSLSAETKQERKASEISFQLKTCANSILLPSTPSLICSSCSPRPTQANSTSSFPQKLRP
jgi:hypothetical protein